MEKRSNFKQIFFVFNIKKNIFTIIFCLFTIFLVVFSSQNLHATKNGITLWINNVVPSLFPFFIATELLGYTDIIYHLEKILTPIMKPIFNVPGSGAYAFVMGIISGYPIGAKIVSTLRENNICTKEECERLLSFTNNSGPLFIIVTVGITMFGNSTTGILLFITHILACITVGILFRFWKYNLNHNKYNQIRSANNSNNNEFVQFNNLGEILSKSIISAINTIILIGGFIVLFSVILSILDNSGVLRLFSLSLKPIFSIIGINDNHFSEGFISGLFEITNGIKTISCIPYKQISINIILTSILLGFGGLSVFLQVFAIISKTDLSIKPYIIGKLLHGIFAGIYTYIFINSFPFFNLNL